VSGEEYLTLLRGPVPVNDAPEGERAVKGFHPGEPDGLTRDQLLDLVDFPVLPHLIASIALLPGDQEDFLGLELSIP
jgi:hypothetical protein